MTLGAPVNQGIERRWASMFCVLQEFCVGLEDLNWWKPAYVEQLVCIAVPDKCSGSLHFIGILFACNMIVKNLPLFAEGTTIFSDDHIKNLDTKFIHFGAVLYLHRATMDTISCHLDILYHHSLLRSSHGNPLLRAWTCFADLAEVQCCCAPDCSETCASLQQPFRRCGGCGVLQYCSHECQRRAWKHAPSPHRQFCAPLRTIMEKTWGHAMIKDDCVAFLGICNADEALAHMVQESRPYMIQMLKKTGKDSAD